jgi:hypothetical protein
MQALATVTNLDRKIFYEFEPHLERCRCGLQILWYELRTSHSGSTSTVKIKKPNGADNAKRRFKCCCVCAEKEWRAVISARPRPVFRLGSVVHG